MTSEHEYGNRDGEELARVEMTASVPRAPSPLSNQRWKMTLAGRHSTMLIVKCTVPTASDGRSASTRILRNFCQLRTASGLLATPQLLDQPQIVSAELHPLKQIRTVPQRLLQRFAAAPAAYLRMIS